LYDEWYDIICALTDKQLMKYYSNRVENYVIEEVLIEDFKSQTDEEQKELLEEIKKL